MTPLSRPTAMRQQRAGQIICWTSTSSRRASARSTAIENELQISMPLLRFP
jgi:hypothetical protein